MAFCEQRFCYKLVLLVALNSQFGWLQVIPELGKGIVFRALGTPLPTTATWPYGMGLLPQLHSTSCLGVQTQSILHIFAIPYLGRKS